MLTGAQMRMARGYLRWSVKDLQEASGVSGTTIKRMEETDGVPKSITDNLAAIRKAFETAGVEFIPENGGGVGVRMRARQAATAPPSQPPSTPHDPEAGRAETERAAAERAERRINGTSTEADRAAEADYQAAIRARERAAG